ncbi:MAG: hypothetical protein WCJ49_09180, partial [Deltaproteobacteria bacterium]
NIGTQQHLSRLCISYHAKGKLLYLRMCSFVSDSVDPISKSICSLSWDGLKPSPYNITVLNNTPASFLPRRLATSLI